MTWAPYQFYAQLLFHFDKSFADVKCSYNETIFRIPLSYTSSCEANWRITNDGKDGDMACTFVDNALLVWLFSFIMLKVQSCKFYNKKYMIASTQITNTVSFVFIVVLVFKLLTRKVLVINRNNYQNGEENF